MRKKNEIASEGAEQSAYFDWLYMQHRQVWECTFAIPNGANKSMASAAKFKREGLKSGVPDVSIAYPQFGFHGAYIEFKRSKGGRLSPSQLEWLTRLEKKGYAVRVCNGFEEAKKFTEAYLKGRL